MFTVFVLIDFDGTVLMENNAFSWLTDHKDLLKIEVGLFFYGPYFSISVFTLLKLII